MRIWVTRTAPDARATAQRLEALGHAAVTTPVLEVRGCRDGPDRRPAAIVFTSANGVRHHPLQPALLDVPVFAVGDRTARAAREAGYRDVRSAGGDIGDLQRLILRALPPCRILHFCARATAGDLAGFLGARGYAVVRRIVYASEPVPLRALVALRRQLPAIDGILIHSPRAARRVARLLAGTGWTGRIWCISRACAFELAGTPGVELYFARRPTEAAMIDMVQECARRDAGPRVVRLADRLRACANDNVRPGAYPGDRNAAGRVEPDNEPPPAA